MSPLRLHGLLVLAVLTGSCGGRAPGRVYRLPSACQEATETADLRRCGGRLLDEIMVASVGLYADDDLLAYVRGVGRRVAAESPRSPESFTFRILDDMGVGAWAGPDGYVYVTRGLLSVLGSEAELAAVLAHEVGHVVSGHTDMALDRLPEVESEDWSMAFRLDHDDQAQADQLSVRYLRGAGYDPAAIRSALRAIYRAGEPGDVLPLPQRLALTARAADGAVRGRRERERYLREIDGLVVGRDPRRGRLAGSRFVHERGGFSFAMPDGFHEWDPGAGRFPHFYAEGPERKVTLTLVHLAPGRESVLARALAQGLEPGDLRRFRLAGYEATAGRVSSEASEEGRDTRLVVFAARRDQNFALLVSGPDSHLEALEATFRRLLRSVRREEGGHSSPLRLRVRLLDRPTTLAALAEGGCASPEEEARLVELNGLALDASIAAGRRVKCLGR